MCITKPSGNAAAMREALEEISSVSLGNLKEPIDGDSSNLYQDARYEGDKFVGVALPAWVAVDWYRKLKAVKEKADAALSAPARNCDVGTAEEQYRRHNAFCDTTRNGMSGYNCEDAPRCVLCFSKWEQMPYDAEEGSTK